MVDGTELQAAADIGGKIDRCSRGDEALASPLPVPAGLVWLITLESCSIFLFFLLIFFNLLSLMKIEQRSLLNKDEREVGT